MQLGLVTRLLSGLGGCGERLGLTSQTTTRTLGTVTKCDVGCDVTEQLPLDLSDSEPLSCYTLLLILLSKLAASFLCLCSGSTCSACILTSSNTAGGPSRQMRACSRTCSIRSFPRSNSRTGGSVLSTGQSRRGLTEPSSRRHGPRAIVPLFGYRLQPFHPVHPAFSPVNVDTEWVREWVVPPLNGELRRGHET